MELVSLSREAFVPGTTPPGQWFRGGGRCSGYFSDGPPRPRRDRAASFSPPRPGFGDLRQGAEKQRLPGMERGTCPPANQRAASLALPAGSSPLVPASLPPEVAAPFPRGPAEAERAPSKLY